MLISPEYLELQRELHSRGNYGVSAIRWADIIHARMASYQCATMLDYGCGRGFLSQALPADRTYQVTGYDPAIPDYAEHPAGLFDFVFCGDVLEHIEPECLDNVLDDLRALTGKVALLVISTQPAVKHLADGRNAHLIVEHAVWWLLKLIARWEMNSVAATRGELRFLGEAK